MSHLRNALNVEVIQPIDLHQTITALTNHIKNAIQGDSEDKTDLILLLNLCYKEFQNLYNHSAVDRKNTIANVYMLLSYLRIFLNINIPFIDPMVKIMLLSKYCTEDIGDSTILKDNYEIQNHVYSGSDKSLHLYAELLGNKIEHLSAEKEEYQKYVSVRPKDTSYELLTKVASIICCNLFSYC